MSPHVHIDRDAVPAFSPTAQYQTAGRCSARSFATISAPTATSTCWWSFPGTRPRSRLQLRQHRTGALRALNGRRVDMVTPKFLNARIRDEVLTSAEPLYDAA